ncbi:MAG TPA: flagellar basal body rod protein FlgB [Firmicutes bacterium]|nr:flagellar basal body rod protein FlgB [Bacillota bacterium]
MFLESVTMGPLERCMELCSKRHTLIANNIANVNTPGYKRLDLDFESAMRQEIARQTGTGSKVPLWKTDPAHQDLPESSPITVVQTDSGTVHRNDGNNVDVDYEMSLLAQNEITYETAARLLSGEFGLLWKAITEGRR